MARVVDDQFFSERLPLTRIRTAGKALESNRGWTRAPYRPCEFVSRGDARRRTGHPQLWPWGADITLAWDNLANLAPAFASGRAGAVPGYRANCTTKRQRRGRGRLAQG